MLKIVHNQLVQEFHRTRLVNNMRPTVHLNPRAHWYGTETAMKMFGPGFFARQFHDVTACLLLTLANVFLLKNGFTKATQDFKIGPIFTKCTVQFRIGNESNFEDETLQFIGIIHFKMDEPRPLQSTTIDIPFIWVSGLLKTTSIHISSINAASLNCIGGFILAKQENVFHKFLLNF